MRYPASVVGKFIKSDTSLHFHTPRMADDGILLGTKSQVESFSAFQVLIIKHNPSLLSFKFARLLQQFTMTSMISHEPASRTSS
jgi:hypothetical protein